MGSFNPFEGKTFATACILCPADSTTDNVSSSSINDCKCQHSFYDALEGSNVSCATCPWGTNCEVGATLHQLDLFKGYWRTQDISLDVRRCPDAASNCSATGQSRCDASTSGCRGGPNANASCAYGLEGPFCRLCELNNTGIMVYRPATTRAVAHCVGSTVCVVAGQVHGWWKGQRRRQR